MDIGNILDAINRASELIDEGLGIYDKLKGEVSDASNALDDSTLSEAQARLANSIQRAQTAHDGLQNAINARLAG